MQGQNAGRAPLSLKDRMTREILDHVQPTHFITLSLCQGRMIIGEHGLKCWVRGDDVIYQRVHEGFMQSLSKRLTPRVAWDRHRPILPSLSAIEGDGRAQRNHLHLLIAKPDGVSEERFRMAVCGVAEGNPWIMNGEYAVDIKNIADDREANRKAYYTLKRGVERICI
ncbi:MAG: hypothetical protein RSE14_10460 [Erythrobacter sp.]|uniref:hypothetical protein n=1 Tax=Erythrobacter sp. TaxID=1042 RepID=UPI002B47F77E|nr:hypothetical protein [Erythrobacter sp.]WRH69699.1 MAG: hypothetical protein RSE14_10460 [Erythrobacter sp.]